MDDNLKLNEQQIECLSSLPEQGIGYHIVDITLKNGLVLEKRIVLNSSILKLENNESIKNNEIDTIKLHLNKNA